MLDRLHDNTRLRSERKVEQPIERSGSKAKLSRISSRGNQLSIAKPIDSVRQLTLHVTLNLRGDVRFQFHQLLIHIDYRFQRNVRRQRGRAQPLKRMSIIIDAIDLQRKNNRSSKRRILIDLRECRRKTPRLVVETGRPLNRRSTRIVSIPSAREREYFRRDRPIPSSERFEFPRHEKHRRAGTWENLEERETSSLIHGFP